MNEQIKKIFSANYPGYNGKYDPLLNFKYWTYLQCVWYSLVYEYGVSPHINSERVAIVDGWFYKFIARKMQEGVLSYTQLERMFSSVPKPDLTVLLDIDPNIAAKRKSEFTFFESGGHIGQSHSIANFISYQTLTRENLLTLACNLKWDVITVDSEESPKEIANRVILCINNHSNNNNIKQEK
jgi:thymidylate kinase